MNKIYKTQLDIILSGIKKGDHYQSFLVRFDQKIDPELKDYLQNDGYFVDELDESKHVYNIILNFTEKESALLSFGWRRLSVILNGDVFWCSVEKMSSEKNWNYLSVALFRINENNTYDYMTFYIHGNSSNGTFAFNGITKEYEKYSGLTIICEKLSLGKFRNYDNLKNLLDNDSFEHIGSIRCKYFTYVFTNSPD